MPVFKNDKLSDLKKKKNLSKYVLTGGEYPLSNSGQLALLRGMEARGVSFRTKVRGFSMAPFIRDRDVLIISPLNKRLLCVGQVVAFIQPENGRLTIHRIIKNTGSGWLLKGDNSPEVDGIVQGDKIIGRVTSVERNGRKVSFVADSRLIAFLSFCSVLTVMKKLWFITRRTAGYFLRRLQDVTLYRKYASRLISPVVISEATEADMAVVHRRFNPDIPYVMQKADPNVTNYVASSGNKTVGFIQLVYHPEDNYPWIGYWLFSLQVWPLYRGMGVGKRLVRCCIEEAKAKNASELLLVVYNENRRSINLDHKLGFVPTTLPGLEPLFEAEKEKTGRRRIVMRKYLR